MLHNRHQHNHKPSPRNQVDLSIVVSSSVEIADLWVACEFRAKEKSEVDFSSTFSNLMEKMIKLPRVISVEFKCFRVISIELNLPSCSRPAFVLGWQNYADSIASSKLANFGTFQ
jgi:hypothetical protein